MTIGEVSAKTDLPESTLRYYEKKGLVTVLRDKSGRRDYAADDIEWIRFIRRLKETGMPLKEIRRYSQLRYAGGGTMPERLKMLLAHRRYVLEQQEKWAAYLQNLDEKISFYRRAISDGGPCPPL